MLGLSQDHCHRGMNGPLFHPYVPYGAHVLISWPAKRSSDGGASPHPHGPRALLQDSTVSTEQYCTKLIHILSIYSPYTLHLGTVQYSAQCSPPCLRTQPPLRPSTELCLFWGPFHHSTQSWSALENHTFRPSHSPGPSCFSGVGESLRTSVPSVTSTTYNRPVSSPSTPNSRVAANTISPTQRDRSRVADCTVGELLDHHLVSHCGRQCRLCPAQPPLRLFDPSTLQPFHPSPRPPVDPRPDQPRPRIPRNDADLRPRSQIRS